MRLAPTGITVDLVTFADEFGRLLRSVETAAAGDGVGAAEGRVLRTLLHRGLSSAALARELGLDTGQLSRLSNSLAEKGLIERGGEQSKKGRTWGLTVAGVRKAGALEGQQRAAAAEAFNGDQHVRRQHQ